MVSVIPSATGAPAIQLPAEQVPAAWQVVAAHVTGVPAHVPLLQESCCVQASPSSHPVPTGAGAQVPVADEQVAHPEHAFPVLPQCPLPSQVWGWEPLHRLSPGAHSPVQPAVVLHTFEQICGSGVLQVPALHVPAAW